MNLIVKNYLHYKQRKLDPRKPLDDAIDFIENTICYDKDFYKFVLDKYKVLIEYDEENGRLYIEK